MRYCIAYVAPEEVQEYFKKTAGRLHAEFGVADLSKRVPAHITLKYPFVTDDPQYLQGVEQQMERVAKTICSAQFTIGGFNRFSGGKETIFMKVEGDSDFQEAVEKCIIGLGDIDEDRNFAERILHVSSVRHLEDSVSDKIFDYLNSEKVPAPHFEVVFDSIALMEFNDEVWKVKRIYRFNPGFVKIKIEDENGKVLKHHYLRVDKYDLPAGKIEEGESPREAAARELLERTGFSIDENKLSDLGIEGDFYLFAGKKEDLAQVAKPGEKGGYETDVRWE